MTDFSEIYELYFDDVYKYVVTLCNNRTIAEEITQETFFKALKNIDKFKGDCKLYVWLCQIAKNTYFSFYNKERRLSEINTADIDAERDFETNFLNKKQAFEIHRILHSLEEPYKEVFTLRMFGELSFAKIGELFNKTDTWARVTYYRAKLKIQEKLL